MGEARWPKPWAPFADDSGEVKLGPPKVWVKPLPPAPSDDRFGVSCDTSMLLDESGAMKEARGTLCPAAPPAEGERGLKEEVEEADEAELGVNGMPPPSASSASAASIWATSSSRSATRTWRWRAMLRALWIFLLHELPLPGPSQSDDEQSMQYTTASAR